MKRNVAVLHDVPCLSAVVAGPGIAVGGPFREVYGATACAASGEMRHSEWSFRGLVFGIGGTQRRTDMHADPSPRIIFSPSRNKAIGAIVNAPTTVRAMSVANRAGSELVNAIGRNFLTMSYDAPMKTSPMIVSIILCPFGVVRPSSVLGVECILFLDVVMHRVAYIVKPGRT